MQVAIAKLPGDCAAIANVTAAGLAIAVAQHLTRKIALRKQSGHGSRVESSAHRQQNFLDPVQAPLQRTRKVFIQRFGEFAFAGDPGVRFTIGVVPVAFEFESVGCRSKLDMACLGEAPDIPQDGEVAQVIAETEETGQARRVDLDAVEKNGERLDLAGDMECARTPQIVVAIGAETVADQTKDAGTAVPYGHLVAAVQMLERIDTLCEKDIQQCATECLPAGNMQPSVLMDVAVISQHEIFGDQYAWPLTHLGVVNAG